MLIFTPFPPHSVWSFSKPLLRVISSIPNGPGWRKMLLITGIVRTQRIPVLGWCGWQGQPTAWLIDSYRRVNMSGQLEPLAWVPNTWTLSNHRLWVVAWSLYVMVLLVVHAIFTLPDPYPSKRGSPKASCFFNIIIPIEPNFWTLPTGKFHRFPDRLACVPLAGRCGRDSEPFRCAILSPGLSQANQTTESVLHACTLFRNVMLGEMIMFMMMMMMVMMIMMIMIMIMRIRKRRRRRRGRMHVDDDLYIESLSLCCFVFNHCHHSNCVRLFTSLDNIEK